MGYRLSHQAVRDIEQITRYGLEQHGAQQARKYGADLARAFAFLADFPLAGPLREEISPPVRSWRSGQHIILYDVSAEQDVIIQRIVHSRFDWQDDS